MNKKPLTIYPNNLEYMREKAGLSRPDLANSLGVTVTTIYRKERGLRKLFDKEAPLYAKAIGCKVEDLFRTENFPREYMEQAPIDEPETLIERVTALEDQVDEILFQLGIRRRKTEQSNAKSDG